MWIYEIAAPKAVGAAVEASTTVTIPGTQSRHHRYSFVPWTHPDREICTYPCPTKRMKAGNRIFFINNLSERQNCGCCCCWFRVDFKCACGCLLCMHHLLIHSACIVISIVTSIIILIIVVLRQQQWMLIYRSSIIRISFWLCSRCVCCSSWSCCWYLKCPYRACCDNRANPEQIIHARPIRCGT